MTAMETTTNDPPPETGVLEQFGTWLETLPAVPSWVQWGIVWLTLGAVIGIPTVTFLWRRWGAYRWAGRSRAGAARRAARLAERVVQSIALSRNRPAMFANGILCIGVFIVTSVLGVMSWNSTVSLYGPSIDGLYLSDSSIAVRKFIAVILGGSFSIFYLFSALLYLRRIEPLFDIDAFAQRARIEIAWLFVKAGIPDDIAAERLKEFDAEVDEARMQEIR